MSDLQIEFRDRVEFEATRQVFGKFSLIDKI